MTNNTAIRIGMLIASLVLSNVAFVASAADVAGDLPLPSMTDISVPVPDVDPVRDVPVLGLDKLRWDMSPAEASRAYPQLSFNADAFNPQADLGARAVIGTQAYGYSGCRLSLSLYFYREHLDRIAIESPFFIYSNQIKLDLKEAIDRSGRRAVNARRLGCAEDVQTRLIPGAPDDNFIEPQIVPLPDANCGFPLISIRLQDKGGAVIVNAHIRADGTVSAADIAEPDRNARFNAAALTIVCQKLRFHPATKNGNATAVERKVAIVFALKSIIHGQI